MMESIRAVTTDPAAVGRVKWGERIMRGPAPHEVVVRVSAFSLNRGELKAAAAKKPGSSIGWDVVGTVMQALPGGPPEGARVVGFCQRQEGWAEAVPMPLDDLAELPDGVSDEAAAALPVAAGTALACIDAANRSLLGRRVLITGVTGGVGGFAVQLAVLSGAHVIAQVRRPDQVAYAEQLGAHRVIVTDDGAALGDEAPLDVVIDGVGGAILQAAMLKLEGDGFAVNYGVTGSGEVKVALGPMLGKGRVSFRGLNLYAVSEEVAPKRWLSRLVSLVKDGQLKVAPARTAEWAKVGEVAQQLLDRKFYGKAVLVEP